VTINSRAVAFAAGTAVVLAIHVAIAGVDVKVGFDKTFDFKTMHTWGWAEQPLDVKMARTQTDDPEAMRRAAEPIVVEAVASEISRRGLQRAAAGPDLIVTSYLLLTTSMSAQTLGQFLPATSAWGLPPFEGATQSLKMMNRGSLVIDLSAKGTVVWRGVAQANVKFDADQNKRETLIREAVGDLLKRYPPKS
jgi:hypothetical protein